MNNNMWAIKLKIKPSETNEERLKMVIKIIYFNVLNISWFITGLEATGEFGELLSEQNYSDKRKKISYEDINNLLNEDGQVIEMQLECHLQNSGYIFIIVQDGCYVSIVNYCTSIEKSEFGDFEDESFEFWKNIVPA